jgi:hypothetical protein
MRLGGPDPTHHGGAFAWEGDSESAPNDSDMEGTLLDSEDGMAIDATMFQDASAATHGEWLPVPPAAWPGWHAAGGGAPAGVFGAAGMHPFFPDAQMLAQGLNQLPPEGVAAFNAALAGLHGFTLPHGRAAVAPPPPPPHWPPPLRLDLDSEVPTAGGRTGRATRASKRRREAAVQRAPPPHACMCPISRDVMVLPTITPMGE